MSDRVTPDQRAEWRRLARQGDYEYPGECAEKLREAVPSLLDENERLREALRELVQSTMYEDDTDEWADALARARRALGEEP